MWEWQAHPVPVPTVSVTMPLPSPGLSHSLRDLRPTSAPSACSPGLQLDDATELTSGPLTVPDTSLQFLTPSLGPMVPGVLPSLKKGTDLGEPWSLSSDLSLETLSSLFYLAEVLTPAGRLPLGATTGRRWLEEGGWRLCY